MMVIGANAFRKIHQPGYLIVAYFTTYKLHFNKALQKQTMNEYMQILGTLHVLLLLPGVSPAPVFLRLASSYESDLSLAVTSSGTIVLFLGFCFVFVFWIVCLHILIMLRSYLVGIRVCSLPLPAAPSAPD